jgi:hypothetical protein
MVYLVCQSLLQIVCGTHSEGWTFSNAHTERFVAACVIGDTCKVPIDLCKVGVDCWFPQCAPGGTTKMVIPYTGFRMRDIRKGSDFVQTTDDEGGDLGCCYGIDIMASASRPGNLGRHRRVRAAPSSDYGMSLEMQMLELTASDLV